MNWTPVAKIVVWSARFTLACLLTVAWPALAHGQDADPAEAIDDGSANAVPAVPNPADPSEVDATADRAAAERLARIFAEVEELEGVTVSVSAGVVHLRGEATSLADVEQAETLAGALDGVVFVDSDIEVSRSLEKRLLPSLQRMGETSRDLLAQVPLLLVGLAVFFAFWLAARWLSGSDVLISRLSERKLVQDLLRQVVKTALLLLGAFVALEILDATAIVGAVLGAAGVVGLALSFAFRDIVENYLASILLSIRSPFVADDVIEIDGTVGVVVRLTTSETMLMTFDGNHVRVPNSTVFKSKIVNRTRNPRRRFDFVVGVGVDEDLELAQQLGLDTMQQLPSILDGPGPYAFVEALGDSNVAIRFFGWIDQSQSDFGKVKSQAIRLVKTVLDEHEIEMPSPIYDINLHRTTRGHARDDDAGEAQSAPRKSSKDALAEARAEDTSPEREIHEQIEEEKATSGEADLLDGQDHHSR